jgi:hypothetical protein
VADRLKLKPKTVQNKMAAGTFTRGIHYFSRSGLGPRFKWSAIVSWIEQEQTATDECPEDGIPMARGYSLGSGKFRVERQ